ncbi:hypothetical protein N8Z47_03655 [Salibacteraceae bacterium]|jgi:hypothetical protein|nr:hypothetical protein [Salibacteraceae bacterium]
MKFSSLFLSLIGLLLSQCSERACTEIGCVDGLVITYELEESTRAEVLLSSGTNEFLMECGGVQTECAVTEVFDQFIVEQMEVKLFQDSTLISSYVQPILYEASRPNGPGCDPECSQSSVTISD